MPGPLLARATPLAAVLALALPLAAQPAPHESLAAAERAFARMAVDSGQWAAFHENLDSASVIFRPRATNGKAWYAAHRPPTPKAGGGTLFWTPSHVGISASADLGFSLGPYRLEGVRPGTADTVRRGGVFATVWGRRPGEPWRVLVDLGVTDSVLRPVDSTAAVSVARGGAASRAAAPSTVLAEVLRADSLLGGHYAQPASADGLAARAADDVRLLRDGGGAHVGTEAARALARVAGDGYASAPAGGGVARAGDLAYTYGSYTRAAGGASSAAPEAGNYLRVWRRDADRWRLVLDVASPVVGPGA